MLQYTDVVKQYGNVKALQNFDLHLERGEIVTLLGPSGCGKTTALRLAAGFIRPTSGKLEMNGIDITNLPPNKRNMGMVFQNYSLFPNLDVFKNVEFGLRTRKVPSDERKRRVTEMLEMVQLAEAHDRYPHQLSGGQQQRVALARALVLRPDVLLLDEPLSALDAKVRLGLRTQIQSLQRELKIATLFVTHDQSEALAISDRVVVMSDGQISQIGSPVQIYNNPNSEFVAGFIGTLSPLVASVRSGTYVEVSGCNVRCENNDLIPGNSITLLVRPEEFIVTFSEGPSSPLKADVLTAEFQGSYTILRLQLRGQPEVITASIPSSGEAIFSAKFVWLGLREGFNRVRLR